MCRCLGPVCAAWCSNLEGSSGGECRLYRSREPRAPYSEARTIWIVRASLCRQGNSPGRTANWFAALLRRWNGSASWAVMKTRSLPLG